MSPFFFKKNPHSHTVFSYAIVPIYDLCGSSFSFRKDDLDGLRGLPLFEVNGCPKDLPGNSLVTVAHTVNSFVGDGRKILSLNVQLCCSMAILICHRVTDWCFVYNIINIYISIFWRSSQLESDSTSFLFFFLC